MRPARPADAAAVAALWTEAYVTLGGGGRTEPYADVDLLQTAARGEVFVAERGDAIVGVVALLPPESLGYERAPERDTVDETGHGRLVFRLALGGGKV